MQRNNGRISRSLRKKDETKEGNTTNETGIKTNTAFGEIRAGAGDACGESDRGVDSDGTEFRPRATLICMHHPLTEGTLFFLLG